MTKKIYKSGGERTMIDADVTEKAHTDASLRHPWTRNFHFETFEEANKKWAQVLHYRANLTSYRYSYYHIAGLPDYVISVSGTYDDMGFILGLLEDKKP